MAKTTFEELTSDVQTSRHKPVMISVLGFCNIYQNNEANHDLKANKSVLAFQCYELVPGDRWIQLHATTYIGQKI